jgi:integrase
MTRPLPKDPTVRQFITLWLRDVVTPGVRPTTAGGYRYICENRILPEWGHVRLRALRAIEVQAFLASELRRGQAPSTVRQTLRILRIALERARRFGLVKANVAREVATPRVARPVIVPLSPREVRALLRVTRGEAIGRLVVLGLAGLRAGELRGLQWGDVELRARRLHVRRTAQWAGKGLEIVPPKTRASVRTIALPRFVVRELARVPEILAGRKAGRTRQNAGMHSMVKRHSVKVLREAGHSQREVAERLDVSERSVRIIEHEPVIESLDDVAEHSRTTGLGTCNHSLRCHELGTVWHWFEADFPCRRRRFPTGRHD